MLALAARVEQPFPLQQRQVARNQRLGKADDRHELADEELTLPQQQENAQAGLVSQGLQRCTSFII